MKRFQEELKNVEFSFDENASNEAEKAEKSLDDMSKAELVAYAKANEIDVNASAKKDDILIAIRDAEEAQKSDDADDDADDGIGEIRDDAADQNLFQ